MEAGAERILLWLSLGLGLLAVAAGFLGAAESVKERVPFARLLPGLALGVGAALLARLVTQLQTFPFEPGQRLGNGLLLGAGAALLPALAAGRAGAAGVATVGCGAALAAVSAALLLFGGYPEPAVAGVPLGMGLVLLFAGVPPVLPAPAKPEVGAVPPPETRLPAPGHAAGFLFAVALSAACLLAVDRYDDLARPERLAVGEKLWWVVPVALGGAVVLGQVVAGLLAGRPQVAAAVGGAVALGAAALLLVLLRGRGAGGTAPAFGRYAWLLLPLGAGWISSLILAALARTDAAPAGSDPEAAAPPVRREEAAGELRAVLGVVLLLALLGAAYRAPAGTVESLPTLAGYGVSLAALGFLLPAPAFLAAGWGRGFVTAAGLLAAATAFRVFYVRYDLDESGIRLGAHYTLIGLLAGALVPFGMAALERALAARSAAWRGLTQLAVAGAVPALLVIFWGVRAGGGLIVGLAIGLGFVLLLQLLEPEEAGAGGRMAAALPLVPVVMVGMVTLAALTPLDFYATHWPRAVRIALVALLALLFPLAAVLRRK